MARHVCRLLGHRWIPALVGAAHLDWYRCRRCGTIHYRPHS